MQGLVKEGAVKGTVSKQKECDKVAPRVPGRVHGNDLVRKEGLGANDFNCRNLLEIMNLQEFPR